MPSRIIIRVLQARDLPPGSVQDTSADAFVEIRLDEQNQKTSTCRKTLNPVWNEDFRFEVADDSCLQNSPVEFKVFDQDLYSSELIGAVYVDLNPLIMRTAHGTDKDLIIQGWFPLYDTTKGVRGSLKIVVKLQFIGNDNRFRDSSAGVQFFTASSLSPNAFIIQEVLGFVVDLVVEDDSESSWQDYFRKATKVSNDNRLKILYNLSARVRRELGKKVLEIGGNAVLGYSVQFDVEGTSGIVARAYGTACRLIKVVVNKEVSKETSISQGNPEYFSDMMNSSASIVPSNHAGNDSVARLVSTPSGQSSNGSGERLSATRQQMLFQQRYFYSIYTSIK